MGSGAPQIRVFPWKLHCFGDHSRPHSPFIPSPRADRFARPFDRQHGARGPRRPLHRKGALFSLRARTTHAQPWDCPAQEAVGIVRTHHSFIQPAVASRRASHSNHQPEAVARRRRRRLYHGVSAATGVTRTECFLVVPRMIATSVVLPISSSVRRRCRSSMVATGTSP
jgi:hypothetical protein